MLQDRAQARSSRVSPWPIVLVAIRPKAPPVAQQAERAAEEVRDEIGIAVRALVQRLQPRQIALARWPAMIVFLPANGGLPTIASKPGFSRAKTSGNSISQWNGREPDARRAQRRALARRACPSAGRSCARDPALDLGALRLARLRLVGREERRDHRVADRRAPARAPSSTRRCRASCTARATSSGASRIACAALSAPRRRARSTSLPEQRQAGLRRVPVRRRDLRRASGRPGCRRAFSAWSRKVNSWSRASVASQSDSRARSTAIGFLSTP